MTELGPKTTKSNSRPGPNGRLEKGDEKDARRRQNRTSRHGTDDGTGRWILRRTRSARIRLSGTGARYRTPFLVQTVPRRPLGVAPPVSPDRTARVGTIRQEAHIRPRTISLLRKRTGCPADTGSRTRGIEIGFRISGKSDQGDQQPDSRTRKTVPGEKVIKTGREKGRPRPYPGVRGNQ